MKGRILPPPALTSLSPPPGGVSAPPPRHAHWGDVAITPSAVTVEDPANAGIRREPELPEHQEIVAGARKSVQEFEPLEDEPDDEVQRQRIMQRNFGAATRQTPLDRADDLGM
jgi:type IV secretion system protein VirD4